MLNFKTNYYYTLKTGCLRGKYVDVCLKNILWAGTYFHALILKRCGLMCQHNLEPINFGILNIGLILVALVLKWNKWNFGIMIYVLTISNLKKAQQCIYVFALILLSGKSFHKILFWLETFHTDPSMLEIITVFLHGENLVLDHECPKSLKPMCNNLREIGLHQMWLGFLPIGMVECQKSCYQQIGSRNSLKK